MNQSELEAVTDVLLDLQQEYRLLQKQIDDILIKKQELDCYVQSFLNQEDNNVKFFSPRNAEEIYKDQIEKAETDQDCFQKELNQLYHDQNLLRSKIDRLEGILGDDRGFHTCSFARNQNLRILHIQEEDRQRIARDLHDTSLQNLAHLIHKIELSSMFIDQDPIRAKLELSSVNKNLRNIIEEIRNTIFNLRPMAFDDLGLKSAFEQLVQMINENKKYEIDMKIEDVKIEKNECENDLVLATIYRVVQECFSNIEKHAGADKIRFHCRNDNHVYVIDIVDNGKGFSKDEMDEKQQEKHFGLNVMKERIALLGGKIEIDSKTGKGTGVHIEIPLN